jgi:serine protease inhibitor
MGMDDAFDMNRATFSGMDGKPNWLYIGAVVHKPFIFLIRDTATKSVLFLGGVINPLME